MAINTV